MAQQPLRTEVSVTVITGSVSRSFIGSNQGVCSRHITPIHYTMNCHVGVDTVTAHGIPACERAVRMNKSLVRASAIVKGRQRLAKIFANRNPGFWPLSALRLAAGMSQIELATRMGVKQPDIALLEQKPGDLRLSTLKGLAGALGVEVEQVIAAVDATNRALEMTCGKDEVLR